MMMERIENGRLTTLRYIQYQPELEEQWLPAIRSLISRDLSEPYSIYVYRYFLYQWGQYCFMAVEDAPETDKSVSLAGVVVCKLEPHRCGPLRGYVAMLAVRESHRNQGIATELVLMAMKGMEADGADEIALETEISNIASLKLYERLGFLRAKKLHRYYLNGNAAYRLVLHLKDEPEHREPSSLLVN